MQEIAALRLCLYSRSEISSGHWYKSQQHVCNGPLQTEVAQRIVKDRAKKKRAKNEWDINKRKWAKGKSERNIYTN